MQKIEKDLEAGRKIQVKFLPTNDSIINGYKFEHALFPSLILSGDFLDHFRISEKFIGFYFADVSGHGASSAFVTVLIKRFIDKFCDNYHSDNDKTILNPSEVLTQLNRELLEIDLDKYCTIIFGIIDIETDKLTYSNGAQFPFPMITCGQKCQMLDKSATPVGLFKFSKYDNYELELCGSDSLYFFSDGVLEILPQEDLKERQAYIKDLLTSGTVEMGEIISKLELKQNAEFPDDITIMRICKVD